MNQNYRIADFFNDPNLRDRLLDQHIYSNGLNFINKINLSLKNNTDTQIDIANITNDQIEVINDITLAKKKPYKSGLQFWVNNYYNELIAITYNNKIICICDYSYSDKCSIPMNNKKFIGNYTKEE